MEEAETSLQNYTQRARDVTNVQDGGNTEKTYELMLREKGKRKKMILL